MAWTLDARVPVRLGSTADAAEGDALLLEEGAPDAPCGYPAERFAAAASGHAPGCACCVARSPAALALHRLFQARARGDIAFFRRILAITATPEGDMAVWSAVRADALVAGRFRLEADR